jgi:hypothetical protein
MPIPFHDSAVDERLGLAGYLRFVEEPHGKGLQGALFLVTARGEPTEFSFSRIDLPSPLLWRPGQARQHAVGALTRSLFAACLHAPAVLLASADEVPPQVFTEELQVLVPLCRVAGDGPHIHAATEGPELLERAVHVFWATEPPPPDSPARVLIDSLQSRGLLTEPFERAALGLAEAFRQL